MVSHRARPVGHGRVRSRIKHPNCAYHQHKWPYWLMHEPSEFIDEVLDDPVEDFEDEWLFDVGDDDDDDGRHPARV